MSTRAEVAGWAEHGIEAVVTDEYGDAWTVAADAADGTLAVERVDGGCGVFVWDRGTRTGGVIHPAKDGDGYGINNPGELVAEGGQWREPAEAI
jgi:hypothetical protein